MSDQFPDDVFAELREQEAAEAEEKRSGGQQPIVAPFDRGKTEVAPSNDRDPMPPPPIDE